MPPERALAILFRFIGAVLLLAIPAIFLPTPWMEAVHRALGLGEMPRGPLVEYLTRSVSALYALHGGLFLLVSTDLPRFRPLALYLGAGDVLFGLTVLAIDLYAGLPASWTFLEGPPTVLVGLVVLALARRIREAPAARG